jgi:hypothetical protein
MKSSSRRTKDDKPKKTFQPSEVVCKHFKDENFFWLISDDMQNALISMQKLCFDLDSMNLSEVESMATIYGISPAEKSLSKDAKKLYYCYQFTKKKCFKCKNRTLIEGEDPCDEDIDDNDLVFDEDGFCFKRSSSKRYFNSVLRDQITPMYPRHYPLTKDLRTVKIANTSQSVYDYMRSQQIVDEDEHEHAMDENRLVDVMNSYVELEASHIDLSVENIQNWNNVYGDLIYCELIVCNLLDTAVNLYRNLYSDGTTVLANLDREIITWKQLLNNPNPDQKDKASSLERMINNLDEFNKLAEVKSNSHYVITIKMAMMRHLQQTLEPYDISTDRLYPYFTVYFKSRPPAQVRALIPNDWNQLIVTSHQPYRDGCRAAYDEFLTELTTQSPLPSVYEAYQSAIGRHAQNPVLFHYLKLGYFIV